MQDAYLKDVFEKAQAMIHKQDFVSVYAQLSEKYPDHFYGQKAFLELGKISLLERKYEEAIVFLKKIYNKEITEKNIGWQKLIFKQASIITPFYPRKIIFLIPRTTTTSKRVISSFPNHI